jgi:5'/3'-nucleotidase SurE
MEKLDRPLILVTNDDGITAPGIRTLIRWMNALGDVVVMAPDSPQSGMGHAITLHDPLRCEPQQIDAGPQKEHACSGTPVDCVKLAVHEVLDRRPDLIVSGHQSRKQCLSECDLLWNHVGCSGRSHAGHSFDWLQHP